MKKLFKLAPILSLAALGLNAIIPVAQTVYAEDGVTWREELLSPDDPTTVRFYNYAMNLPGAAEGIQNLADTFNETIGAEKGIVLEMVSDDTGGTASQADVQAGLQVDIVQQTFSSAPGAIESKGYVPLNQIVPQGEIDVHLDTLYDNTIEMGEYEGEFYAIPWTFSTPILYLNTTILEEAGIPVDAPPADWDEMYDWAVHVTENTDKVGLAFSPTNRWVHDSILYSNGAQSLNDDGTEVDFNSPEALEALGIWKQFYIDGVALGGPDADALEAFMAGKAAMHIQSTSVYSGIISAFEENGWELDGYPMPGFDGEPSVPTQSGSALFVRKSDEKQNQANWEVVKYLSGPEAFTIITSEIGYLPLVPGLEEDPQYLQAFVEENPIIGRNIDRIEAIRPSAKWPASSSPEAFNAYMDFLDYALTTDVELEEAANQATDQINALLQQ